MLNPSSNTRSLDNLRRFQALFSPLKTPKCTSFSGPPEPRLTHSTFDMDLVSPTLEIGNMLQPYLFQLYPTQTSPSFNLIIMFKTSTCTPIRNSPVQDRLSLVQERMKRIFFSIDQSTISSLFSLSETLPFRLYFALQTRSSDVTAQIFHISPPKPFYAEVFRHQLSHYILTSIQSINH